MSTSKDLPPVRACIFDVDGLLIDSEDAYTRVTNTILHENGRPSLPWTVKAQLQGRPGPQAGQIFQQWAQLSIDRETFIKRQSELQAIEFQSCKPLPGVEQLLTKLGDANSRRGSAEMDRGRSNSARLRMELEEQERFNRVASPGAYVDDRKVQLAVATSSHRKNFEIKTKHMKPMFSIFHPDQVIVGDDDRVPKGRGKPLPDIYLLALQCINEALIRENGSEKPIKPEECLVFEDSVPGVEAGRRAGMRVVWVPHPGLLDVYKDRIEDVLAGRTGEHKESDLEHQDGIPFSGSPGHPGELGDGWAEMLSSLEEFDYAKYGIDVSRARFRSESGQPATKGTTDKELEEMTAKADGKLHAPEEGTSKPTITTPGLEESTPKI